MAHGISTRKPKPAKEVDPEVKEAAIQKKIYNLANAIKIPAPINQFRTQLEGSDLERTLNLLRKYSPETREQKRERLSSKDPRAGPKPILLKFGLKHVVDLIMQKKPAFIAVAADVAPITLVLCIPTLCHKFKIPYCIVPSKAVLGSLVHLKTNAVIALEDVRAEDKAEFNDIIGISNAIFLNQYEKHMSTVGGRSANKAEL